MKTVSIITGSQTNKKLCYSLGFLLILLICASCKKEEVNVTSLGEYRGSLHLKSYDYSGTLTVDTVYTNTRILVQKGENNKGGHRTISLDVYPAPAFSNSVFSRSDITVLDNTRIEDYYTEHGPMTTVKTVGSLANDSLNFNFQYIRHPRPLMEAIIKAVKVKQSE